MRKKEIYVIIRTFAKEYKKAGRKKKTGILSQLKTKIRSGAKVTRIYDTPLTAYQRLLKRKDISKETKQKLRIRYEKLNPKKLLLEITNLGKKLSKR